MPSKVLVEVEGQAARYKVPNHLAVSIPAGTVHRTTIQKVRSGSIFLTPDMAESAAGSPRVVSVPNPRAGNDHVRDAVAAT